LRENCANSRTRRIPSPTSRSRVEKRVKELTTEVIPQMMDENDVEKFTIEGVGTIYVSTEVYAYVKKEDEAQFFAWLRENGNGDIIREYVFPKTLQSFAKEQLGNGVDLPEFLKAAKVPTAKLRRN
jgi:hypothetical protein